MSSSPQTKNTSSCSTNTVTQAEQSYIDRLTGYMTITQKATDYFAGKHETLKPHYDAAVVQWNAHRLRTIPHPQNSTLRSRWYEDVDAMLSIEPSPDE